MTESPDIKMSSDKGPDGAGEEGSKDTDCELEYHDTQYHPECSSNAVTTSLLPVLFQLTIPGQYARGYRSYGSLPEGNLGECKGRLSRETGDGPRSRFVISPDMSTLSIVT
jgi:hypothetical protein